MGDAWLFKQRMLKPGLGRGGAMGVGLGKGLVGMGDGWMVGGWIRVSKPFLGVLQKCNFF